MRLALLPIAIGVLSAGYPDGAERTRALHRASSTQWVMWSRSANVHSGHHNKVPGFFNTIDSEATFGTSAIGPSPDIRLCSGFLDARQARGWV